jgi:glycosyltransferase family protein
VYGNSFVSRFYMDWADKSRAPHTVASLRTLWAGRDVVFIEGEESRLGVGNDLFLNTRSVRRILAPKRNAFDRYDELLAAGAALEKEALLILALGPTATVLSRSFHLLGYQALDLGHVDVEYEWLRMGATTKVPVPFKHVNEATDAGPVRVVTDPEYQKQIIARIL